MGKSKQPNRLVYLNIEWDSLTYFSQENVARLGLKVHWKSNDRSAQCGRELDNLIWTAEDEGAVTCQNCLSGLEKQIGIGNL